MVAENLSRGELADDQPTPEAIKGSSLVSRDGVNSRELDRSMPDWQDREEELTVAARDAYWCRGDGPVGAPRGPYPCSFLRSRSRRALSLMKPVASAWLYTLSASKVAVAGSKRLFLLFLPTTVQLPL